MAHPNDEPDIELDDEVDTDEVETDEEEVDPAELRLSVARLQAALDKERAKTARLKGRQPKEETKPATQGDDSKVDVESIRKEARAEALKDIISFKAESELTKVKAKNPTKAMRLLDLSDVERLEDGSFEGLDEAIEALQEEFPELFEAEVSDEEDDEPAPRRSRVDAGRQATARKKKPDAFDLAAQQLFGRRR